MWWKHCSRRMARAEPISKSKKKSKKIVKKSALFGGGTRRESAYPFAIRHEEDRKRGGTPGGRDEPTAPAAGGLRRMRNPGSTESLRLSQIFTENCF